MNVDAPADRVRHTLAHELGHMLLHTITLKSDEEMEDEADAFAGAFLLPAVEIKPIVEAFRSASTRQFERLLESIHGCYSGTRRSS